MTRRSSDQAGPHQDAGLPALRARLVVDHRPRPTPHLVPRPRLLTRLDARTPLTVLRAPLGFGKTTLVAQWLAGQDPATEVVAWLRVRPGFGDSETVWADLLRVLADAGLQVPADPRSDSHSIATAEQMIAAAARPVLLVVDGFENITEVDVDRSLLDVLRYAPELRLIVCGRSHRQFAAHLSVDLETTLVSAHDLLFTAEETAQLITAVGLELPRSCVETIHAASGGWPEPTRAFVLAARDTSPTEAELVAAAHAVAIDYLRRHLLPEVTRTDRVQFALSTAIPEEFTVELATVLSGNEEAKAHLEWLEGEGFLLVEMRDGQPVYRWPGAARQALLAELQRADPERVPELHSRLGRWYLDAAQPTSALQHAVPAKDWSLVIEVIESSFRVLVFAGRNDVLHEALIAIPLDAVATSPLTVAARDPWLRVPDELLFQAAALPATSAELAELGHREDASRTLETGFAVLRALRLRGLLDRARSYAGQLLEIAEAARATRLADILDLYPALQLHAGIIRLAGGDFTGALHCLWQAYTRAPDNPRVYLECDAAGKTALTYAVIGDLPRAALWLRRHDAAPLQQTWLEPLIRVTGTAARLLIAIDRLDIARATDAAADDELSAPWPTEIMWIYLLYAQAQYALYTDTAADMLEQLDRARATFRHWLGPGSVAGPLLAAAEADLLLALGRGNPARAVLHAPHAGHPLLRVAQARLALLSGQADAARRLATDSAWEQSATQRHRLEMLLIHAVAAHRTGDTTAAADALQHAADAARATGSLSAFTTVPRAELARLAEQIPAAAELLADPALAARPDLFPRTITLIELTEREQRVLEKLADGLSLQQTATALIVSYNTVRTQQASLYRKLGTNSRPDAIARARQFGLLRQS